MLQCGNTTCNYQWLVKWQSSDRSKEGNKSSHCLIMGPSYVIPFSVSPKDRKEEIVQDSSEESCLFCESIVS